MKLKHAELIAKTAYDYGVEVEVRENYSGRGMFGKTTAGVVGNMGDIVRAVAGAAADLAVAEPDEVDDFVRDMNLSFDNMGFDMIAY